MNGKKGKKGKAMEKSELEEYYRSVLDDARETVFIFDEKGQVLYANKTAFLETRYPDLRKVTIFDVYPIAAKPGSGPKEWLELKDCETFAYRENKSCYPVKLSCNRLGETKCIAAYAINDSERCDAVENHNKAMEEVEAANRMKNEFTANITHELRTPINGIRGMARGLEETNLEPAQEEAVGVILHCCENMSKIIDDLLDFSKIEAGKIELENREFSLDKLIRDTLAIHVSKINEKGLKLIVNVTGPVPDRVVGDELRLGQVLNNLLSNATKFTSSGHIGLELSANRAGRGQIELFFMVIDTGIGISDEEKDKLFKSFSQVDGSITRRFGGTGLGLAISRSLVTLMGGRISVDSEKGKGSTFSFTVKVKEAVSRGANIDFPEGSFEFTNTIRKSETPSMPATVEDYGNYGTGTRENTNPDEFADELEKAETDRLIRENIEKVRICMDLGAWEKAEGFASSIRDMVAQSAPQLKPRAFSLLLNVRKEKIADASEIADELGKEYGI